MKTVHLFNLNTEYPTPDLREDYKLFCKVNSSRYEITAEQENEMVMRDLTVRKNAVLVAGDNVGNIQPRTIEEIFSEMSREEYNNWHQNDRHRNGFNKINEDGEAVNIIEAAVAPNSFIGILDDIAKDEIRQLFIKNLKPKQAALMIAIVCDGKKAVTIAHEEGKTESAICQRIQTAVKNLVAKCGDSLKEFF